MGERQVRAGLQRVKEVAAGSIEEERALLATSGGSLPGEKSRPVDSRRNLVGVDAKRIGEGVLGLDREPQRGQRLAAVRVGLGQVGFGEEGQVVLDERLGRASSGTERHAQAAAGLGQVGRHLQRVFERHLGPLEVARGQVLIATSDLFDRTGVGRWDDAGEEEGEGKDEQEERSATGHGPPCSEGQAAPIGRNSAAEKEHRSEQ